jgi:hypothetical protein
LRNNLPEPEFVKLLRSLGIDSRPGGPVRQPYSTYRPARNRFVGDVYKFGLRGILGIGRTSFNLSIIYVNQIKLNNYIHCRGFVKLLGGVIYSRTHVKAFTAQWVSKQDSNLGPPCCQQLSPLTTELRRNQFFLNLKHALARAF